MIRLKRLLTIYFVSWGLLFHFSVVIAFFFALNYFVLTPRQFIIKLAERSGIEHPALLSLLEPDKRYEEHVLDGILKTTHPRIILPELAAWNGSETPAIMRERAREYNARGIKAPSTCNSDSLMFRISCWITSADRDVGRRAVNQLLAVVVETPDPVSQYGNGWQLALSYDLLAATDLLTAEERQQLETKIQQALVEYLRVLDDDSASLWHGRTSLAANAWLLAVALTDNSERRKALITRAQGHFLESMQALAITEVWPEGYNYWINNRAFYVSLAAAAYINGLDNAKFSDQIKQVMERVGLWHVYATRPDNRAEGLADEGPRIDLKDETRRVIDIIATLTDSPALATYSYYLQKVHGTESYFRGFRWGLPLFNDPFLLPAGARGELGDLEAWLPHQALFGRDYTNQVYGRSSWRNDATFFSFQAGHHFTHHGHYGAGHFSLFKGTPLAVNSSSYGNFNASNRLNYSIRTVAKNSLLIQRPGEKVQPTRFFTENVSDGGQRITMPNGSAITSVQHWRDNLDAGLHLKAAELQHYAGNERFVYVKANISDAYNNTDYDDTNRGGKVSNVKRSLFYLKAKDLLLVNDDITTTRADYRVKWLLHSLNKPQLANTRQLVGAPDNGILASNSNTALIDNAPGSLKVTTLYPTQSVTQIIGGEDYRYYVETDGDDSQLDGKNYQQGASNQTWFDQSRWRMEVFPAQQTRNTQFLVALQPSLGTPGNDLVRPVAAGDRVRGALIADVAVVFATGTADLEFVIPPEVTTLYLVGASTAPRSASLEFGYLAPVSSDEGVYVYRASSATTPRKIKVIL